jgi:hypothetical protein
MPGRRQIHNGQAAMPKANMRLAIKPIPAIIRPTMNKRIRHATKQSLVTALASNATDKSHQAAHNY